MAILGQPADEDGNEQVFVPIRKSTMTSMIAQDDSFPRFLVQLQARDGDAAREVFRRFTAQLIALTRRRFAPAFRCKVDPEDVVQSAYKSFFLRYGDGRMEVDNWSGLWGLLTLITLRKCSERVAYHRAGCRDLAREATAPAGDEDGAPWREVAGREPTPLEAAELGETVERLLADLNEGDRPVIELSLQGYTVREISQRLDRVERTVRRTRERVRLRLERLHNERTCGS
jgi:RNA polymerase sigma factor (sigma-70 family)